MDLLPELTAEQRMAVVVEMQTLFPPSDWSILPDSTPGVATTQVG
jgi:hypothetical protein